MILVKYMFLAWITRLWILTILFDISLILSKLHFVCKYWIFLRCWENCWICNWDIKMMTPIMWVSQMMKLILLYAKVLNMVLQCQWHRCGWCYCTWWCPYWRDRASPPPSRATLIYVHVDFVHPPLVCHHNWLCMKLKIMKQTMEWFLHKWSSISDLHVIF